MGVQALGFDVYGTLVDPLEMGVHLESLVGERAPELARVWREKQLEYSFRRGLMGCYQDFSVCTRQALEYAQAALGVVLGEAETAALMDAYQRLSPFADAIPALERLQARGHRRVAFSNGEPRRVEALLNHAGVLAHLQGVISVDELKTFKPDPRLYHHLAARLDTPLAATWLISSNPFDVIGAKAAGIRAAWVRRSPGQPFDPWGIEPDLVVSDLIQLVDALPGSTAD